MCLLFHQMWFRQCSQNEGLSSSCSSSQPRIQLKSPEKGDWPIHLLSLTLTFNTTVFHYKVSLLFAWVCVCIVSSLLFTHMLRKRKKGRGWLIKVMSVNHSRNVGLSTGHVTMSLFQNVLCKSRLVSEYKYTEDTI